MECPCSPPTEAPPGGWFVAGDENMPDQGCEWKITVDTCPAGEDDVVGCPYVTESNMDSDYLMVPFAHADFDSETQFCVDRKEAVAAGKDPTRITFSKHYKTRKERRMGRRGRMPAPEPVKSDFLCVPGQAVPTSLRRSRTPIPGEREEACCEGE